SLHAEKLYKLYSDPRALQDYKYLPYGPFSTLDEFLTKLELARRDSNTLLFTVFDLALEFEDGDEGESRVERIAGIVGVKESRKKDRMTEIGHVHIPPQFQRTHVTTHSLSLLLRWTLDPPSILAPHNLGLRRTQWFANPSNQASITVAQKMGFKLEAPLIRWERSLEIGKGKESLLLPRWLEGDRKRREEEIGGRYSSLLAVDWEDWEGGGREFVEELLRREVRKRNAKDVEGLMD
ncbi:hypothetical protein JCM5353_006268, partial [Sporobolomyces roseus]